MRTTLPLKNLSFYSRHFLLPLILLLASFVHAATITSTTGGGSWTATTTWVGGVVPVAGDDVVIDGNVTIPNNTNITCKTLTVNSGKTLTLGNRDMEVTSMVTIVGSGAVSANGKQINYGAGAALVYSGTTPKVTGIEWPAKNLPASVTILNSGGITLAGAKTLTAVALIIGDATSSGVFNDGGFQITSTGTLNMVSGTFRLGNATTATTFPAFSGRTLAPGTTIEYASGVAQTVAALPAYANLTLSGGGTKTLAGNVTVAGNLTVAGGTLDLAINTANCTAAGGTFTAASGASLILSGGDNFPANYTTYALDANSIVNYAGADQTVAPVAYGHLLLSGNGVKTLPSMATTIAGNFTTSGTVTSVAAAPLAIGRHVSIGSGSTFDGGAFTHSVGGNWFIYGTFMANNSTIDFTGPDAVDIGAGNFYNVAFSGAGTKTLTGPITVEGNLTISNNLTAGPYTHTVGGNWTNNGSFNGTSGTVVFNGSAIQAIGGTAATTFNNLSVQNSAGLSVVQHSTITGALTLANGGVDVMSPSTITVKSLDAGAYQLTGSGNYTLPAGGSISTAHTGGIDNGTIAVTGTRNYAATGVSFTFHAPTANPIPAAISGVADLTIAADVTLNKSLEVAGVVTLSAGKLTIPAGAVLHLASPSTIGGGSFGPDKHIVTAVNTSNGAKGFIQVDGITGSYTFPVGNGTYYLPVTLTPSAANNFGVCVFPGLTTNGEPNGTPISATQKTKVVDAVWMVNRLAGSGGVDMAVEWPAALEGAYFQTLPDLSIGIAHYGVSWEAAIGSGDNAANAASRSAVGSFSPFSVGIVGVALPVKFSYFQATRKQEAVSLEWGTSMEENNRGFTIQRKTDRGWQDIAFVPSLAVNGSSSSALTYTYKDINPYNGVSQYRLLQVDIDGHAAYSQVRSVRAATHSAALVAYPNPSPNGTVHLVLDSAPGKEVRIVDFMGRLVKEYRNLRSNTLVIDRLHSGLYTVQVVDRSSGTVHTASVLVP